MVVNPPSEWAEGQNPTSSRQAADKYPTCSATVQALIEILAKQQLSIKEMLAAMNLKDRENFYGKLSESCNERRFCCDALP